MYCPDRFDAREENCIPLSIDRAALHVTGSLYNSETVRSIKKVKHVTEFWNKNSLLDSGFYHPVFCLNLHYSKLFLKYKFKPISFLRKKKSIILNSAYMFFSCGNDLYGIPEFWNHMVVELFGETEQDRIYYDSYLDIVRTDYPHLSIEEPTHQELIKKMTICLIVRRR